MNPVLKGSESKESGQPLRNLNLNDNIGSQDDAERVIKADQLFEKYFPKKK